MLCLGVELFDGVVWKAISKLCKYWDLDCSAQVWDLNISCRIPCPGLFSLFLLIKLLVLKERKTCEQFLVWFWKDMHVLGLKRRKDAVLMKV